MRPLKLTMRGFGSYAEETVIDFTRYDDVFLITGDNGAGKTMIFDAIMYALYGESSGSGRDKRDFYSTSLHDEELDIDLYVKYEFRYKSKNYTIIRSVCKKKANASAAGNTSFCEEGQPAVTKNISEAIKAVFPLDAKQFRQCCMLAQGKFAEIFTANTKTRQELYRDIFGTEKYFQFIQKIDKKYAKALDGLTDQKKLFFSECKTVDWGGRIPDDFSLKDKENAADREAKFDDALAFLNRGVTDKSEKLKALEKEINNLEDFRKNSEALVKNSDEAKACAAQIVAMDKSAKEAEQKVKEIADKKPETDVKMQTLGRLKKEKDVYDDIKSREEELAGLVKSIVSEEAERKKSEENLEKIRKELAESGEEFDKLEGVDAELVKAQAEEDRIEEKLNRIKDALERHYDYSSKLKKADEAKERFVECSKEFDAAQNEHIRVEKLFLQNYAGVIASQLEEGDVCPVCGKTYEAHSAPHRDLEEVLTEDEVDFLRQEADKAREARDAAASSSNTAVAEVQAALETLRTFAEKIIYITDEDDGKSIGNKLAEASEPVKTERLKACEDVKKLEAAAERRKQLAAKRSEYAAREEKTKAVIAEKTNKISSLTASRDSRAEELEKTKKGLAYDKPEELDAKIKAIKTEIETFNENLEQARRDESDCKTTLAKLKGEQKKTRDLIEENPLYSTNEERLKSDSGIEEIKKEFDKASAQIDEFNAAREKILAEKGAVEKSIEKITEVKAAYERTKLEMVPLERVHDKLAGQKFNLEHRVLARHLDRIIANANEYFLELTENRYKLIRDKDLSASGYQGLGINVFDIEANVDRGALTASGGESFKASLAMALAFAETVSAENGGIQFDSVFIDEGFGTLDDHSVKLVMKMLNERTPGKLVGIISHVDEIKRMPNRIEVRKDSREISHVKQYPEV